MTSEAEIVEAMAIAIMRCGDGPSIYGDRLAWRHDQARAALQAIRTKGCKVMVRPPDPRDYESAAPANVWWDDAPVWPGEGR